jgi:hypothetical protein
MDVPPATLDAVANVTGTLANAMKAKRVGEAKTRIAALLADAGQKA